MSDLQLTFRYACEGDAPVLAKNVAAMAKEGSNKDLDISVVQAGVDGQFQRPENGFYVVAEKDNEIIASLLVVKEWSTWSNGFRWWTHDTYTKPEFRQQGVYTALKDFLRSEAERINAQGQEPKIVDIKLSVHEDNKAARTAYEKDDMYQSPHVIYVDLKFPANG